ncbi:hypothetical protein CSB67_2373 [Enterobacter hormaechei]|nr:hypothetical protein CSB67_2373 [Enterobacter hormaechei]
MSFGPVSANPSPVNSSDGGLSVSLCPFRHPTHQPEHSPQLKEHSGTAYATPMM